MTAASIRAWSFVHTWTSLICTLFMLLLCLTGLPLIFHHEIDDWFGSMTEASPATGEKAPESRIIARALADHPGKVVQYVGWDTHEPDHVYVILHDSPAGDPNASTSKVYDIRTAAPLGEPGSAFMRVMLRLHVDMFAGLPGTLFLGGMGLLLVAAIVSGVVLYWPFTRRLDFGTIRPRRSRRVAWLDLHNLLGIVTVAWLVVVGFTGSINTLAQPLIGYWKQTELGAMIAAHAGRPAPARLAPFDDMLARARAHAPAWPGLRRLSGHAVHHRAPLRRVPARRHPADLAAAAAVLLDGETGAVADARGLPWYLTALLVSQPLHFGDYGGLPLKIIWALLDVVSIVVLGSGLYLWWTRRARGGAPVGAALPGRPGHDPPQPRRLAPRVRHPARRRDRRDPRPRQRPGVRGAGLGRRVARGRPAPRPRRLVRRPGLWRPACIPLRIPAPGLTVERWRLILRSLSPNVAASPP